MKSASATVAALLAIVLLLFAAPAVQAQQIFSFVSTPGDPIGAGESGTYTPANTSSFQISTQDEGIDIYLTGGWDWHISLIAGKGDTLHEGRYRYVERSSFRTGRSPGLEVTAMGRGCNDISGEFGIKQIEFDATGKIAHLEADFLQYCDGQPPLAGVILYRTMPLSLKLISAPGDYVGRGISKTYYGDTSTFALAPNLQGGARFAVSGQGNEWIAFIDPPVGQQLRVGTFSTSRLATASTAGLDFYGNNRNGYRCNQSTGTLVIKDVRFIDGFVVRLLASFTQYCDGNPAPLKGTIRYLL
ncbi:hypothetical protein [Lysobacter sp. CFH 32150]|uniref:hypothetical protein n=1 Tax=Lysobacter sp. CFH 32150 TaxID=2927128 RepID=UPI001FA77C34|nr:hypothetical protein [Lysobacter sp. CFH 32150]MCI4566768.1 hypothetical protein [Lysobacter sp. CFH 32150]